MVIVAAVAGILALLAVAVSQANYQRVQAEETAVESNRARVIAFEQFVLRTLEAAELATQHLVEHVLDRVPDDATLLSRLKHDQTAAMPLFSGIVISPDGRNPVFSGIERVPSSTLDEMDRVSRSSRGGLVVTRPLPVAGRGNLVAVVRSVPADRGGGFVAVLIEPAKFTDFSVGVSFHSEDLISLIGLDGITRARRQGSIHSSGEDVRNTLVMRRQFARPNGTYLGPSVLDGTWRYFSHRRIPKYQLFATSGTSLAVVRERIEQWQIVRLSILIALVLAICAASFALLTSMDRRQRRLNKIMAANIRLNEAQRIGKIGDWDYFPGEDRLHWSDNLRAMYGRDESETVSKLGDIAEYSDSRDISRVTGEIRKVLETGATRSYELNARMRDGTLSARRIIAAPVYNDSGEIIGVHGIDQDVTGEVNLRRAEERLQEIARLDSMGALAATLAHELNQPLGSATNYLAAAKRRLGMNSPKEVIEGLVRDALRQLHHLSKIIESARDLVKHDAAIEEVASVPEILASVVELLRSIRKGRRTIIETYVEPDAQEVWANVAQLKQVLFNLGRNGIEALADSDEPKLVFTAQATSDGWQFCVTDNGPGMPEDFDPFATLTTNKKEGLGLGLSICRTIIEAHGGRIWVDKSSARGTTVCFFISSQSSRLEVANEPA
ncbi:sensor histidine kinase [Sphingomonas xanthus]|uniref:sensor histidine kinase n=1 Tax=Sphingomonas xanthus TaxID=2594473 RepID=UPI00164E5804|nr:ATP-binding protein [Sphingomonas xanthus]